MRTSSEAIQNIIASRRHRVEEMRREDWPQAAIDRIRDSIPRFEELHRAAVARERSERRKALKGGLLGWIP